MTLAIIVAMTKDGIIGDEDEVQFGTSPPISSGSNA